LNNLTHATVNFATYSLLL